jgi:hypothetical protein
MANWPLALFDWVGKQLGLPSRDETWKWGTDWDYAQCNDFEVLEADSLRDQVDEAVALRKTDPKAGFLKLQELAEHGSVWSMVKVAACYRTGLGVAADAAQAEEWYRRASEQGCESALLNYCSLLISRGDRNAAEAAYSVAAAKDWAPALFWLAQSRTKRSKSHKTLLEVRPLIERAAALGSPNAKWILARNTALGRYGLRKIPRGLRLVSETASQTHAEMTDAASINLRKNDFAWFQPAATKGIAKAQTGLGKSYAWGPEATRDYGQAMAWFEKAAAQGDSDARYNIGRLYFDGLGVPKDYDAAMSWFMAAAPGSAAAQDWLGRMYENGFGVAKSLDLAVAWFEKAAGQGFAPAQYNMGRLYLAGDGVDEDYAQAMSWYRKAAAQGDADAQGLIGYLYVNGLGVATNYHLAMEWFQKAAARGDSFAEAWIGSMYMDGLGVAIDRELAWTWFEKAAAKGEELGKEGLAKLRQ